jgi:hypothetical protein
MSLAVLFLSLAASAVHAQETLTQQQRNSDLIQLASQYAKNSFVQAFVQAVEKLVLP